MRKVELTFDDFGWEALEAEAERLQLSLEALIARAAVYFEGEIDKGRPALQLPPAASAEGRANRELELDIREGTWQRLRREASRQSADVERLLEHAALLFLADLDSGRAAERLL